MCTSVDFFKNDNYSCIVLENTIENKVKAKKLKAFLMEVSNTVL